MSNKGKANRATGQAEQDVGDDTVTAESRTGDAGAANGQVAVLVEFSRGNIEAMLKAGDIFARGIQMLNTAWVGSTCMAVDDAIAEVRAAMSCRTLQNLIAFEADTAQASVRRYLCRASVLGRMATQLAQDALFPLQRRLVVALDLVGQNAR